MTDPSNLCNDKMKVLLFSLFALILLTSFSYPETKRKKSSFSTKVKPEGPTKIAGE